MLAKVLQNFMNLQFVPVRRNRRLLKPCHDENPVHQVIGTLPKEIDLTLLLTLESISYHIYRLLIIYLNANGFND